MKAIVNANIFDYESYRENQYILFKDSIIETGPMEEFVGASEVFDAAGNLVLPGLAVAHTHIYSAFARGLSVPFSPESFEEILSQLWWKLDANLDREAVYHSALLCGIEFVKNGVTSVIDHHASGLAINGSLGELKKGLCDEIGLRGLFCFETSDRFDIGACIRENLEFSTHSDPKSAGLFGLHASLSLSDQTLAQVSKDIRGHSMPELPIHVHVAESLSDEEQARNLYGKRVVERLFDHGLLNEDALLAHCIHINEREAQLIAKSGSSIVMNPASNMNNAVGLPDFELFKKYRIPVMLGNDGLGFNFAKDIQNTIFAMHHRQQSPTSFTLDDLKELIQNGYDYVGRRLHLQLGKIQKGFASDLLVVEYDSPTPMNASNAFAHIIYGVFDNFRPKEVICNGVFLMKDYQQTAPVKEIFKNTREVSQRVWHRISKKYN